MSAWRRVFEVARRDLLQRARSRVFLITTLLLVMLILAGGPLLAALAPDSTAIELGVVGTAGEGLVPALDARAEALDVEYELTDFPDRDAADQALREGDVVAVMDGYSIVWLDDTGPITNALVSGALQELRRVETIEELGLTQEELTALFAPPIPETITLEEPDPEQGVRQGAAYAGAIVLFMSVVLFGQFVLLGVLEEKSNRVAEVVLSRVRPVELLAGKIMGIGLLGLGQLIVIGAALIFAVSTVDIADLPNLSEIGLNVILTVVFWYVLGYSLYSVLYAAAGSLVSRQEDVQGVSWIPMIGLLPAYFIALAASIDPDTLLVRVASMFPGTAPMVMPVRASATDVPLWEYLAGVAVTIATIYLLVRLAARIYQGGILRSGRIKLREAWRGSAG